MRVFEVKNLGTHEDDRALVHIPGSTPVILHPGETHTGKMPNVGSIHIYPIQHDTPALFDAAGTMVFEGAVEEE